MLLWHLLMGVLLVGMPQTRVVAQTMVYLERSQTLEFDEARMPDAQILRGDVCFRHDSAWMYCDSAYFYEQSNSVTAMGHVRFVQGDTLSGYGDILYYDGNTKLARLRRHVRLIHRSMVLSTDSCNYDRIADLAYYFSGGEIVDSLNTLTSVLGQYRPAINQATFRKEVHLTNPNFTLDCDTLLYNTATHIAKLVSPTTIVYEGETHIYSSDGWYNTETELSSLYGRSLVHHVDGRTLTADTIFYDKVRGFGQLLSHMELVDSAQHSTLYGNYGEAWEDERRGFATDSALLVEWSDSTAYSYTHADTLFTVSVRDTLYDAAVAAGDSVLPDSTYFMVHAYHNVRIYREDMQAVCDSMKYFGRDSVMTLYKDPVCWNENNQVSADTMRVYIVNEEVDHLEGIGSAIASQVCQYDTTYFNQMAGKHMKAYVIEGEMRRVEVSGNAETVFYPEDNGKYIGMNTTRSPEVTVYLRDQTIDHIRLMTKPEGVLYPLDQIPSGKDKLTQFFWATQERPRCPEDVFLCPPRTPRRKAEAVSATVEDSEADLEAEKRRAEKMEEHKHRNRKSTAK